MAGWASVAAMDPIGFVAYSDYLCPWCYLAAERLERLERENPDVTIEWRSYLLRPHASAGRDLAAFRRYTESWRRPAAEAERAVFRPWASDAGPPTHSVPAHLVAKAAAELGDDAFRRVHSRLLEAYFAESRDISDDETLRALWREAGLDADAFERREDPCLLERVLLEHEEAQRLGAGGVPSLRLQDRDAVITGALPYESYQRWVAKERARRAGAG